MGPKIDSFRKLQPARHAAALVTLTLAAKVLSAMSAAFCSASVEEAFQISALFLPLSPNPPRFHLRWS